MALHVARNVAAHERVAVLECAARRTYHKGLGHLARALRGDADDDAVYWGGMVSAVVDGGGEGGGRTVDGGVGEEVSFELGGGDLVAFDFDESAGGRVSVLGSRTSGRK